MARLDEHRGKQLLGAVGIALPKGGRAETPDEAYKIAADLGGASVVKALALVTGRAGRGWVRMADTAEQARDITAELLKAPEVNAVRVEEKLDIKREFFAAVLVDDAAGKPNVILSSRGGSGIEEIAREHPEDVVRLPIDISKGLHPYMARGMAAEVGITSKAQVQLGGLMSKLYKAFRKNDCRSLEINPVVETAEGKIIAADCHAAVDDYAIYRHPEMGVRIAREIGHDPNETELIAYEVEKNDYRGTFYFIQLADATEGDNFVAFHGAGGGGSMMSMDALMKEGFQPANFCDTSGNPPASKVYRAAKIMLGMPGIVGYFASGSGVASQEQWQSAYGMVKAFREMGLKVPAVIRLGGNQEEKAIATLEKHCSDLGVKVEGYGKDDSARFCAERLRKLVDEHTPPAAEIKPEPISAEKMPADAYRFKTITGEISINQGMWTEAAAEAVVASCPRKILKLEQHGDENHVVLAIDEADAKKGKCIECLACELTAYEQGCKAIRIDLPLPTKDGYQDSVAPGFSPVTDKVGGLKPTAANKSGGA